MDSSRSAVMYPSSLVRFQAGCSGTRESSGLKSHDFSYAFKMEPLWSLHMSFPGVT